MHYGTGGSDIIDCVLPLHPARQPQPPRHGNQVAFACMSWIAATTPPQPHIYRLAVDTSLDITPLSFLLPNMETVGAAASIIAIIEVSAKVASLCLEYSAAVKDASDEITRLQTKVQELEGVTKDVQQPLDGDRSRELSTSQKLNKALQSCCAQMKHVKKRLHPSGGRKIMSKFGVRALKWRFESKEVDKITNEIEMQCKHLFSSLSRLDIGVGDSNHNDI